MDGKQIMNLEQLKEVVGGDVELFGQIMSAQDLIDYYNKNTALVNAMFPFVATPEKIAEVKAELATYSGEIPAGIKKLLGME